MSVGLELDVDGVVWTERVVVELIRMLEEVPMVGGGSTALKDFIGTPRFVRV